MYEGGLRVPFIFSGPGVSQNTHTDVPVTGLDILPTLARLAGYQDPLPSFLMEVICNQLSIMVDLEKSSVTAISDLPPSGKQKTNLCHSMGKL